MTVRLYLETNFLVSHAMGRDSATSRLIEEVRTGLQIALPSCCVMEALTLMEGQRRRINQQVGSNLAQINEFERNSASPHATALVGLLQQANRELDRGFVFFQDRMDRAIEWLSNSEHVELLATRPNGLSLFSGMTFEAEPTDQLILATILDDAGAHPSSLKVLLTENHRCFHDEPTVRKTLQDAGIKKYFPRAAFFLQWYEAGAES